jgi:hypothetical protein
VDVGIGVYAQPVLDLEINAFVNELRNWIDRKNMGEIQLDIFPRVGAAERRRLHDSGPHVWAAEVEEA